ncbi:MAG: hypothetical protein H0T52_03575 [Lautropia sp.]|nr:hypothetical protein [Lautropia sp.]
MSISDAVTRDGRVYVYGKSGEVTARISVGTENGDGLINYTPSTVTVRKHGSLFTYGEDGSLISHSSDDGS